MKLLLIAFSAFSVAGSAQEKPASAESPAVPAEQALTGTVDVGYRWVGSVGGDFNAYRSVVNLGSGPKLFGLEWTAKDPSRRFFDRAEVRAYSWGGDPYNTAQVDVRRDPVYRLLFDYRRIAYFNFLPSFANPGSDRGLLVDERSFDTFRRTSDIRLTLFPSRRISPYVAYTRNSGTGSGISVFFGGGNEFPVGTRLRDHSNIYRAGVQIQFKPLHVSIEQGGTTSRNDQQLFNSRPNAGNIRSPFQPFLGDLVEAYGIRGDGIFTRALFTSAPVSWISLFGQFLFSQPRTKVRYSQTDRTFFLFSGTPLNTLEQVLVSSNARLPHSSGSLGVELRPGKRLRITESWLTDRLHDASAALVTQRFLLPVAVTGQPMSVTDRLAWNYNQQEINLLFDLSSNFTLRGGHRYVWGNAVIRAGQARPGEPFETGDLGRHVGLAGLNVHSGRRLTADLDFESSSGQRTLFRTGLQDYDRASFRGRYQVAPSLVLAANFFALRNVNPAPSIDYHFFSRENEVSATWNPGGSSKLAVTAEYSRYTLRSRLNYIAPSRLIPELSLYRDNGHIGSSIVSLVLPAAHNVQPRLTAGGSFFVSSGSRPTRYFQPLGRLSVPVGKHADWNSEWRWYALSEPFYVFEGFRVHQFVTGLHLTI